MEIPVWKTAAEMRTLTSKTAEMRTPVWDFVRKYADSGTIRFHMPGHKGRPFIGCEAFDLTEITGADSLYEASGILAESETNAATLFDSARTVFSTEGSSQCIRAMIYLAAVRDALHTPAVMRDGLCNPATVRDALHTPATVRDGLRNPAAVRDGFSNGKRPVFVAARNAHKTFVYAAALCDAEIVWLWPQSGEMSVCSCPVTPEQLRHTLETLPNPPAGVYITSPDYLGGIQNIAALAEICHMYHTPLLVDNAHGAYLHFLTPPAHPLDLGADMCCDSAHKTLPVLTGGAYVHVSRHAPAEFADNLKDAMALFGSTSPSYLILSSLDLCNAYLSDSYSERLTQTVRHLEHVRECLREQGWHVEQSDPLRLTLRGDTATVTARLRANGIEWEYADREYVVLMATPENTPDELERIPDALGQAPSEVMPDLPPLNSDLPSLSTNSPHLPPLSMGKAVMTPRQAIFAPHERIAVEQAVGRICAAPVTECPPAIPIVSAGEQITPEALLWFQYYGIRETDVVREKDTIRETDTVRAIRKTDTV